MRPACGRRAAVRFYLSQRLVRVCEIEISLVSKNNGNADLVCENIQSSTLVIREAVLLERIGARLNLLPCKKDTFSYGSAHRVVLLQRCALSVAYILHR